MESRLPIVVSNPNDADFNAILFEKKLMQLKDSQESINSLSAWCLENRSHHKKIVIAWLSVLKKVKVEQRLTLFYLANDVIQYSKRKNYDFVESWGTTLQKATTLVREEKVKTRILRIFKIWEQRGIYGEEFITDLSGLISASPVGRKLDQDPQEFQPSYLINRIKGCAKLENETDLKLKQLKDSNPKITDSETLCASLKDRQHVEDVEKEVESGITLIEGYVNALKAEIKSRTHLISCLSQADTFYNTERKEVKVVVSAYKNFTTRVKNLQKKLNELIPTLSSPIPSPDVNAPSPEPDSDIELPNPDENKLKCAVASGVNVYSMTETYNAGYYTPASTQNQDNFANNGFSSFMGSNMPFDLQNFNASNIFSDLTHNENYNVQSHNVQHMQHMQDSQPVVNYDQSSQSQPIVNYNPNVQSHAAGSYNQNVQSQPVVSYNQQTQQPLLPPPMPPFTTSGYMETAPYADSIYVPSSNSYGNNSSYESVGSASYAVTSEIQTSYVPTADAYNPEEEIETWEPEAAWDAPPDLETPESPPMFEKEGFSDPIEYDDSKSGHTGIGKDVDHRVLLPPPQMPSNLTGPDTDHRISRMNVSKDVDHRNLISLTGSPRNDQPSGILQPPPAPPTLWAAHGDQDYRNRNHGQDHDYRVPVPADIARQLKLPPPPPPPPKGSPYKRQTGNHDNVESIDMELSDDENTSAPIQTISNSGPQNILVSPQNDNIRVVNNNNGKRNRLFENNKILTLIGNPQDATLEPPPPIPQKLSNIPAESDECESVNSNPSISGKNENGPMMHMDLENEQQSLMGNALNHIHGEMVGPGPPPIPQLCDMVPGWGDDWYEGRPPPDFGDRPPFPTNFSGRHKSEFRGGYRGRSRGIFSVDNGDGFRGRGGRARVNVRTRPFRGGNPRGSFNRGARAGFRGQFRGTF